jgi:hypothetical protein
LLAIGKQQSTVGYQCIAELVIGFIWLGVPHFMIAALGNNPPEIV